MEPTAICGWTKLYSPRGPQATLPLVLGTPEEMLRGLHAFLDAGWLVIPPGLEEGELKENVAYVVKGSFEKDGQETPYVLLYSDNEAMKHSFLKVYLNTPEDVAAFEYASKLTLAGIPDYVGQDKPERGKNRQVDRFITPAPKPFGVVYKTNPKYDEHAATAARAKNDIYRVPRRLFVRWADMATVAEVPETISDKQVDEIDLLLPQAGYATQAAYAGFLKWIAKHQGNDVQTLRDVKTASLPTIMDLLRRKAAEKAAKGGTA